MKGSKNEIQEYMLYVKEYSKRTLDQNAKIHAMLGDISNQCLHLNRVLNASSWKRLCVAQYRADSIQNNVDRIADYFRKNDFELLPSLDGQTLVVLGEQTRDFPIYVAIGFIEWINAYGDNHSVVWSEPVNVYNYH
jgi:hypothetical protein